MSEFGTPHEFTNAQLQIGETITLEGTVDNGFYGDSEIYIGDSGDIDEAFKSLQGTTIRLTITRLA